MRKNNIKLSENPIFINLEDMHLSEIFKYYFNNVSEGLRNWFIYFSKLSIYVLPKLEMSVGFEKKIRFSRLSPFRNSIGKKV